MGLPFGLAGHLSKVPGAVWSGVGSLLGGERANKQARDEAQKNRDFQASQTSTAWQRGVKDMEAAGLNPALAYGQGPAASGGGSMASQQDTISPAINSGMAMQMQKATLKNMKAQRRTIKDQGEAARAAAQNSLADAGQTNTMTGRMFGSMQPGLARSEYNGYYDQQQRLLLQQMQYQMPQLEAMSEAWKKMPAAAWLKIMAGAGVGFTPLVNAAAKGIKGIR
ncbi:MAG: DNA pilot protein [Microviridae sp.]|nr:MAG: DNA pilot protein [Microviridae sp.]